MGGLRRKMLAAGMLCVAALAGCSHADEQFLLTGAIAPSQPSDQRPSDEPAARGQLHFRNGDYGLAEKYFRAAAEANPHSADAWIGLAASYDRLRRFDLAGRAYQQAMKIEGPTPALLNNLGYHYLLRGDLRRARETLQEAARKDPGNVFIQNNLKLLATWTETSPGGGR